MPALTKLLEEAPGVRSITRFVALMFACLAAVIVLVCCYIAVYAIVHAKQHEEHAAAAISSAGAIIFQLGTILLPVIGGIWVALKLRKPTPDEPTVAMTQVTMTGPANAAPSMQINAPPAAAPAPGEGA